MEVPKKIRTVDEELAYLQQKFGEKKEAHEKVGVVIAPERIEQQVISEYKSAVPAKVLAPAFEMPRVEIEKRAEDLKVGMGEKVHLSLTPEEHDEKMQELIALAKEKGIKNALSIIEKLGNYHITDDFHRFISEYVQEYSGEAEAMGAKADNKDKFSKALRMVLYEIVIPEETDSDEARTKSLKEIVSSMEQFYAGLLSISDKESGDNVLSLEIANANGSSETVFYVSVPEKKKALFEKQILSTFHTAKLSLKPDDYNIFNKTGVTVGSVASLSKNAIYPLKTYESFDHDPLNSILQSFSKVDRDGEGASIQLIWAPAGDYYLKRYKGALDKIMKGTPVKEAIDMPETISEDLFKGVKGLFAGSKKPESEEDKLKPKVIDEIAVGEIKKKMEANIVRTNLRILASSDTQDGAEEILRGLESSFNQFQNTTGNSIEWRRTKGGSLNNLVKNFSFRMFEDDEKMALNMKEITTFMHFHLSRITSNQNLRHASAATSPAPAELATEGILLGLNKHQNSERKVFMKEEDRLRHFYTIGQTGTGKSTLLKNMIIQDIQQGNGLCMIDPHGSDILDVLACVPKEREKDVIYFDPAYTPRPMALNMMEYDENFPEQKTFVVNELFSIFKKLYGNSPESMGPAFEQYFRNSALLVMDDPSSGNTLIDVSRVLSDKAYRELKLSRCKNPLIVQFWRNAEKTSGDQGLANYVQYVTNKFDVFLSNEIMRPIIAQEKSTFNFREIMDNKKILLVNLSKGRLGDMNANLIGLILVGKILMAALSRGEESRKLPPFYLYIDEFQNVTTDSIATILSEARKYKLSLNIAHQYIAQLEENIKNAVFGNVGSMCSFRVGSDDAEFLEKQFNPVFSAQDLMNIDNRNAYLKLLIDGKPVKPFNIETVAPLPTDHEAAFKIRELSYQQYGRPRSEIEALIQEKYLPIPVKPTT